MEKHFLSLMLAFSLVFTSLVLFDSTVATEVYAESSESYEVPLDDESNKIPNDAVTFNGHSYYIYNNRVSYDEAESFCKSLGGHLATITSMEENDFLYEYIRSKNIKNAYFGFTDRETEGAWKWVNGEESSYTNWASGEPNAERSNEDYAMFYWKFTTGKWNDGNFGNGTVSDDTIYICEWDVDQTGYGFSIPEDTNSFHHTIDNFYYGEFKKSDDLTLDEKITILGLVLQHKAQEIKITNQYYVLTDELSSKEKSYTYPTSDEYYKLLTKGASFFEKCNVKSKINKKWEGSCNGIAITMALASQQIQKEEFGITENYNSSSSPKYNRKLRDAINFYHLSQFVGWGEDTREVTNIFWNLFDKDGLHDYLTELVDECKKSKKCKKPFIFTYGTSRVGHTIVAYGMTEKSDGTYILQLYDMDNFKQVDCEVDLSKNTIRLTDGRGIHVNEENYHYFSYIGIDDLYGRVSNNHEDEVERTNDHQGSQLALTADKKCTVRNNHGKELRFDGEKYSGDMLVYSCDVKNAQGEGECQEIYFDVEPYEELIISDMDSEITMIGELEGEYYNATVDGADSVVFADGRIELKGDEYSFNAAVSAGVENDTLYEVSADASGDVNITSNSGTILVEAENNISNTVVTECSGVDAEYTEAGFDAGSIEIDTTDESGEIVINPSSDNVDNESCNADSHTFGDWITTTPATEIAAGVQTRTCSVCGYKETQKIAKIKPSLKTVKILKPKVAKKSATIKWKKLSKKNLKKSKKIQIQYSTDKNFKKNVKSKYVKATKTSYKLKKLKSKKKYYVRIRAYTKKNGKVHVSKWSAKKSFKAK